MTSKRKNDVVVSEFDQTWYGRFYRWMNWDVTEEVVIKASPEDCLAYLKPEKDRQHYQLYYPKSVTRPYYGYNVKTQAEKRPYWFMAQVILPGKGRSSPQRSRVFATIVRHEDEQNTLITLRTYPFGFFFSVGFVSGIGAFLYGLVRILEGTPTSLSMTGICAFILILASLDMFYTVFTSCRESLALIKDYCLSLNHWLEGQTLPETVCLLEDYPKKRHL